MFIFGHIGITIGVGMLIEAITNHQHTKERIQESESDYSTGQVVKRGTNSRVYKPNIIPVGKWLDYRLLVLASMLPDIIDKPMGQVFLKDTFNYGRIYGHTLVFVLITGILGMWVFKKWGKGWLLIMAFGSFMHDMEDQSWRWPQVLLWPLKGWGFPKEDLNVWLSGVYRAIVTEPDVFIPELVGIVILALAAIRVFRNRRFQYALKTGHIN